MIKIELDTGNIVMILSNYNENIKDYLFNLPHQINILILKYRYINDFLEGCFTNLPISIKKILFIFDRTIEIVKYFGNLNILFGAKLPFDCIMEVLLFDKKYIVQQENSNNDELILFSETGEKIIYKYVKNIDFGFKNYNVLRLMSGMNGLYYR